MLKVEGSTVESSSLTVRDYLTDWLAHMRTRVRASTYDGYSFLVQHHALPALGHLALGEVHPLHIQHVYARMTSPEYGGPRGQVSAKTAGNLHRVLRLAFSQAAAWRLIDQNPAAAAYPPRARPRELAVVDQALALRLLEGTAGTRLHLPSAIAISTGMRRGEILGLRWADIDSERTVARVNRSLQMSRAGLCFEEPKTRRSRRAVALPSFLRPYLDHQEADQGMRRERAGDAWQGLDLVVDSGDGGAWNPDTFSTRWAEVLVARALPHVRFHDLRHAHATFMLMQGVHPKIVSERLGHSSVGITLDTYSHVLPTMQTEAVRAFDELFGQAKTPAA